MIESLIFLIIALIVVTIVWYIVDMILAGIAPQPVMLRPAVRLIFLLIALLIVIRWSYPYWGGSYSFVR